MATILHKTLTTEREIAAYLHRTRMTILEILCAGPATASQIAARMGVHPANLTRHMRTLEAARLIALVETRATGRNVEKYYAAAAETFDVAPGADALTAPHKVALSFARSDLSAAVAGLPDEPAGTVKVHVVGARLAPDAIAAFTEELSRLANRFAAADETEGAAHHLTLAIYPGDAAAIERAGRIVLSKEEET